MKRNENGNFWPEPADLEKGCPCCGADVSEHEDSGEANFEYWRYGCGSGLVFQDDVGRVVVQDDCPHAMRIAINARNRATVQEFAEWVFAGAPDKGAVMIELYNTEHHDKTIEVKK